MPKILGYPLFTIPSPSANARPVPIDAEEIVLGEEGRGRAMVRIPVIGTGEFARAKLTDQGIVVVRLEEAVPAPAPCLAAINAAGAYHKNRHYQIPRTEGLQVITAGNFADGMAGRACSAEHALCLVQPGAEFWLQSKYSLNWHTWDGVEWRLETPAQRNARLALAEVEAGGGEWL